jgi:hypothetical protein
MKKKTFFTKRPFFGEVSKGSIWRKSVDFLGKKINLDRELPKTRIVSKKFSNVNKKYPNLFHDFNEARRQIMLGAKKVNVGKMKVSLLNFTGTTATRIYKVEIFSKNYFIKEIQRGHEGRNFNPKQDGAYNQLKTLEKARNLLKGKLKYRMFKIAIPHAAFNLKNHLFLVTDFYMGQPIKWVKEDSRFKSENGFNISRDRFIDFSEFLLENGIGDAQPKNMMYDIKRKKVIVFDLRGN